MSLNTTDHIPLISVNYRRVEDSSFIVQNTVKFRKQALSCIYPSKYKPPPPPKKKNRNAKNPTLNRHSKYKPTGGLYLEIALKYKVKQSKDGKFPTNYKASPIDFEKQISFQRLAPPNISPSKKSPTKRAFEKYKPRGLFSEFYGSSL